MDVFNLVGMSDYKAFKNHTMLEDYNLVGGDCQPLYFYLVDNRNKPYNLEGFQIIWSLAKSNKPDEVILKKDSSNGVKIVDKQTFKVEFDYEDTSELTGRYIHQIELISPQGNHFFPCHGIVKIQGRLGSKYIY